MSSVLFVTGIDTNIGKSYATAYLKRILIQEGKQVVTQKMIQTGNEGRSEDIELHRRLLGEPWGQEDEEGLTAPIVLSYPASPHLAALIDKRVLDISLIDDATDRLLSDYGYDIVLLEGAGGLMVPITKEYWTIDFIAERGYPIVLVTSGRLGSINHTLLTLSCCKVRGIQVAYLIYNLYPNVDKLIEEDTLDFLKGYCHKELPECQIITMPEWR